MGFADGRDVLRYETNYAFLVHELTGGYNDVLEGLRRIGTLEEATDWFMTKYLSPHPDHAGLSDRVTYARAYLNDDFTDAGCLSHHDLVDLWGRQALALCPGDWSEIRPRLRPEGPVPGATITAQVPPERSLRPKARPGTDHLDAVAVIDPFEVAAEADDPGPPGPG